MCCPESYLQGWGQPERGRVSEGKVEKEVCERGRSATTPGDLQSDLEPGEFSDSGAAEKGVSVRGHDLVLGKGASRRCTDLRAHASSPRHQRVSRGGRGLDHHVYTLRLKIVKGAKVYKCRVTGQSEVVVRCGVSPQRQRVGAEVFRHRQALTHPCAPTSDPVSEGIGTRVSCPSTPPESWAGRGTSCPSRRASRPGRAAPAEQRASGWKERRCRSRFGPSSSSVGLARGPSRQEEPFGSRGGCGACRRA